MSIMSGMRRPKRSPSKPKTNAPTGAHRQCQRDGITGNGNARDEIMRHRHDHEREQKKIERVQCPSEETSEESVPLIAVEQFEKPDRFHGVIQLISATTNQHE